MSLPPEGSDSAEHASKWASANEKATSALEKALRAAADKVLSAPGASKRLLGIRSLNTERGQEWALKTLCLEIEQSGEVEEVAFRKVARRRQMRKDAKEGSKVRLSELDQKRTRVEEAAINRRPKEEKRRIEGT